MPFPEDFESFEDAGYVFNRSEECLICGEDVEIFITPGGREITMNPMHLLTDPAIQHYKTCNPTK
jgi:hypothetical protein